MTITSIKSSSNRNLDLDSIPIVDLRLLTQSELNSLSQCSTKSVDLHQRCDNNIVIPKIDRSVFNESAGSRKQTYSRLRLAPRKPEISAVGRGRYNPVPKPHSNPVDDPERKENKEIVSLLRDLFANHSQIKFKDRNLELAIVETGTAGFVQQQQQQNENEDEDLSKAIVVAENQEVGFGEILKRKRGRPRKDEGKFRVRDRNPKIRKVEIKSSGGGGGGDFYDKGKKIEDVVMEIVNRNGVVVDLAALGSSVDPYGPELNRRTIGLTTEEELLAFLRELKGQWGSRRKKRKVVDACDFGDALPIGWKLLISLRRKEGSLSLYCRRYISPTGEQFASCKEVSSYLLPFFGFQDEDRLNSFQSDESDTEAHKLSSSSAGFAPKDESTKDEQTYSAATPIASFSSDHDKQLVLLGSENLADVEIRDLLECHICKMNFDEKDAYLQHLLSSHQKSTKRSRHSNTSVCDGVIIRDGKFECQFCHKVFDERRRYNGHVGVHVRNYVRSLEQSSGGTKIPHKVKPSSVSEALPRLCGVDAPADNDNRVVQLASTCSKENSVEQSPASRLPVLSREEESDDIDKGLVSPTSIPSGERTIQNNVKSPSVSRVLPRFHEIEASLDKGSVPPTSIPSEETSLQKKVKPSSSSSIVLPLVSREETSDDIDKDSVPLISSPSDVTVQNNIKLPSESGVPPGFPGVEASPATDNGSVLVTSTPCDEAIMQNDVKLSSGQLEASADTSNDSPQISTPSNELNIVSPSGKLGAESSLDVVSAIPTSEPNSPQCKPDSGVYNPQYFPASLNVENVHRPDDNLISESISQKFTFPSNFGRSVGSPFSNQDIVGNRVDETLGGVPGDKQDSDIEMTDDKQGRIDMSNSNLNVGLRSCLDPTAALCNNVEYGTPETFEGKDFFTSTTDCKLKINSVLNSDFRSCLESVSTFHNNVNNGTDVTYERNNVFASSADGINMSGLKQGEGSFSFSFAPPGSQKANGLGISTDEVFSLSMKVPELDRGKGYGFNEAEKCFSTNISQSNEDSLIDSINCADKGSMLQRLGVDTSSSLLQSSGCYPTLDLMSNMGQGENGTFPLQKFDNMSGFEGLGFDDLEPSKFGFVSSKETNTLTQEPMDLAYDSALEDALNTSVQFEWEPVLPKMDNSQQQSAICVWCRVPFNHDAINLEMQSDSVGFMCPTCKAKISGQLNVVDNDGLSMNRNPWI
ncbi:Methyl-cpg-binding domain-containing protein [Thalictrum thalictroides]|uniref:Methyl-cpg-binding domain-containing protein n=1 Tax=Thalictrum thalictroides TaxID=46969 RepID=A0A7J6VC95_THATH|nr:Methyl-cpg-binding domain-containing protein [Thalictrum thalictroides]